MRVRDKVITAQGVLSLVAITAMLGYAAYAMQLAPRDSIAAYAQDRPLAVVPQPADLPPALNPARSAVYSGTIVTHGSGFVLRQPSGAVYHLDDPSQAQRFAGKPVKVTGKLDQAGILLHIEKIEEVRA
jgi:hypothetical protein